MAEKYLRLKEEFFQTKKKTEELSKQLDTLSSQLKERDENSFQSRVLAKTAEVQEKMKKGKKYKRKLVKRQQKPSSIKSPS